MEISSEDMSGPTFRHTCPHDFSGCLLFCALSIPFPVYSRFGRCETLSTLISVVLSRVSRGIGLCLFTGTIKTSHFCNLKSC